MSQPIDPQRSEDLFWSRLYTKPEKVRPRVNPRMAKRWCLVAAVALIVLFSLLDPFVTVDSPKGHRIQLISALVVNVLALLWCHYDSVERDFELKLPSRILLVLLLCVGLPVYLIGSRGWRGLFSIGLLVLYFAACVTISMLVSAGTRLLVELCT
jgi:hypothetical protein